MRGLDDLGARMDRAMPALSRRHKYMNFRIASREQANEHLGAPVIVTDAYPVEAHPIAGEEISECTTF